VLSACSSLIAIIGDRVQFSHFSVKEYLTSDRLQMSDIGHVWDYHLSLEPAHTLLGRACVAVLLQFDENLDKERVATFPLAKYASVFWVRHAKFEGVQSQIQDDLKCLFDPKKPHLRACNWMHKLESVFLYTTSHSVTAQPPPLKATPLYYAAYCGFSELARWLITAHAEDVNAKCYDNRTPLLTASQYGHVDVLHVLLDHGADVNSPDCRGWTPLHSASCAGNLEVVQLLLEHEATLNARAIAGTTPLYLASRDGRLEVVRLLLSRGADVHLPGAPGFRQTPLQCAMKASQHDIVQLLLEHGAKRE
jgi:hypothetical protein